MKTTSFRNILLARPSPGALTPSRFHAPLAGLHVLLALAISALASAAFAQTWQTLDDFQYAPSQSAQADGLTVAPNGTLFACGWGDDSSGFEHALVMASADGGNTWSAPLDDFVYPGSTQTFYNAGIVADAAGKLYVAGFAYDPTGGPDHWIVRRSTN